MSLCMVPSVCVAFYILLYHVGGCKLMYTCFRVSSALACWSVWLYVSISVCLRQLSVSVCGSVCMCPSLSACVCCLYLSVGLSIALIPPAGPLIRRAN